MSNQLEDDLRRVLRLARAQARENKKKNINRKIHHKPDQRHRHDQFLTGSKDRHTLLTAKLQGLSAIYGLDSNSRYLRDCSNKSVLLYKDTIEDEQVLQQRLDARRTLYKRHFSGSMADSSGNKRELEHVLEAAARAARSSRVQGVGIGAAVLTESQTIYSASAIDNGALTLCAEQAVVMKMVTRAANSSPVLMVICSEQCEMLPFPCGKCRELLADCGDFPVHLVNGMGETEETRSSALFPRARHSELTQIATKSQPNVKKIARITTSDEIPLEVKDWATDHVLKWLQNDVELPEYCDVFERNNVDGCTLVLLEGSDLQLLLGITHPLHRSKLLTSVDRLRDRQLLARGLDYTQLEDYLAVLDIDRVSAVAQLKITFDRLDADQDGFLDFTQVKQALSRLRCEVSAQAVERLLHSEELFGKEAASTGKVNFPAFARAFSKLAAQPADTSAVTQGAFTLHAFGPRLPVLEIDDLRKGFEQLAKANTLDEPSLAQLLKELGQSEKQSKELACRWMDAQDDDSSMTLAQFITRYAQLMDCKDDNAEATAVSRLQELFRSYEPVHSAQLKPRTVVQRALSTLFPMVPGDEVNVWCATFWPAKVPRANSKVTDSKAKKMVTTLTFPEFTLACLEFAVEAFNREQEAASIKKILRNDALVHRSRVVHLHSSGHVRMCPQPIVESKPSSPKSKNPDKTKLQRGKSAEREGKGADTDEEETPRRTRREQQVDEAFERFTRRHGVQIDHAKEEDSKQSSDDDDERCMLNAVEAAQAALELGVALSREQVMRYLEREGLGRIRRRDISRAAFHRLMKRLEANQIYPRDLLLDVDDRSTLNRETPKSKQRSASKSPRYKSRPDYDDFLRQKLAKSNGTQWEKEVQALRRKKQHREERKTKKHRTNRSKKHEDDGKHDSESESDSNHSETSTETDSSTESVHLRGRRGFEPGARVASMVHGRGTIERLYRDYYVADVHFDSGRHLRNVELSGLRLLDPEDEPEVKPGFNVGTQVTIAYKGTKTRRKGKIILCRTDGTFDVLVNEFGLAQTLKRITRSSLELMNVKPTIYREGARVMVRQRTEYLRGKIYTCRTDGTYDVKLTRSPQRVLERLTVELLAPDDGEDGDSDDEIEEIDQTKKDSPKSKPAKKLDSDDNFEPEFTRGDRVEARFGGQSSYYPGTIERVHPNGSCDISYDDGDEEERVSPNLIRALKKPIQKPTSKKKTSDDGYESDLFESD
ncbi:Cytidine deaminase [Phytophthora citrophthora]|uniref:Cytidine deaminase n=1 Tax=Phytophthora citrophthora TaxID=4793 RepID=A0AAD9GT39_9STRA|nr:Cytidine deaminase [Phytophthora citrophthora]